MPPAPFRRLPLVVLVLAAFFVLPSFVEFYTDWLWFGEVGYQQVYLRKLATQSTIALAAFAIAFAFLHLNLRFAFSTLSRRELVVMTPDGPRVIVVEPGRIRGVVTAGSALLSLAIAAYAGARWETWLLYRHATPFNRADPILGRDIAYYLFELPLFRWLQGQALVLLGLTFVACLAIYVAAGRVSMSRDKSTLIARPSRVHLSFLAAGILLALAVRAWLDVPTLLTESSGLLYGASYTDVYARIPTLRVLAIVAALGAALAVYQAFHWRLWPILAAAGVYIAVSLGGGVYATVLQRFFVAPNEQVRETPYLEHNIRATRAAFALDRVEERELSGEATLTRADIDRNAVTLENVPLWNHQPLLDTFGQLQEIRPYYDFVSVDNDRYVINGTYRQIMLSAREMNSEALPNRTWINERLTFTHGYGLTLGPVNQVVPPGLPVLFVRNLPLVSTVDLPVTEPSIYFGELSNDHVLVRTKTREFHYPAGDENVFNTYDGKGGVGLSFLRKVLFSARFRSMKTLLADDLTSESRVLFHRRVAERVRLIAPFLQYDPDPYLAIDEGRLLWVQDAYTTSHRYPYSTPAGNLNYIRNSIKAVVDAYHGTTRFYLIDPADPVAATIDRAFPGLLQPASAMPKGLRERLRYPQTIFAIQAAVFSTFHMGNPALFYNKEDQWEIPTTGSGTQMERMEPYYTIMRLPGGQSAEYIQMLPFTPRQKDNLAAWMVARSDGPHYGKLMAFRFPKQKVVFGPRQVVARINQDQLISPQITLWNQQGSEVIQGTLLVIPIEEALIYVRPLYLRASGGRIPELKRVIVAYENEIVMEETLDRAINRLFARPGAPGQPATLTTDAGEAPVEKPGAAPAAASSAAGPSGAGPSGGAGTLAQLAGQARDHYERAQRAQREGNWALYGEEVKKLGDVLQQMTRQSPSPQRD